MLDVETKNRINTARDILVGKVPDPKSQVEQITIALIYKFMDDMDLEAEELGGKRTFFVNGFSKYSWRKIFDPRLSGYELLNLYGEAITKMDTNPGVPKLFRDIFKNAYLPYRDPETLKSFLKVINEFEYTHSEKLGDAFEYLLSVLGSQGDAGQFRTPRHIIDFMVAIIDPQKNETILDPACGTSGFLISSFRHIIKHNSSNYDPDKDGHTLEAMGVSDRIINSNGYTGDLLSAAERRRLADNIYGYDISPDMVRLSLVNMYLHGIKEPHISEYDTLTSEDHWNHFSDLILANPPFMSPKGGIRPHKRFSVQSNRSEVLFVDYIAEHLTSNGRAAVIVPEGIIFQSGNAYKQLRKMLVEEYLVAVISLPAGIFQPYSGVKTSILWIDKTLAKKTDKILFVKIKNDGYDLGAQRRAIKENDLKPALGLIKKYCGTTVNGHEIPVESDLVTIQISRSEILENRDVNLSSERYRKLEYTKLCSFPMFKIGEVCSFEYGKPLKQENRVPGPYFVFGSNGIVDTHNAYLVDGPFIVVGRKGSAGEVHYSELNGYPIDTTFYIKLQDEKHVRLRYLYYILKYANLQNVNTQAGVPGLNRNDAYEIEIPVPPAAAQDSIISELDSYQKIIDGARMVVENYKPRVEIDPKWEIEELGKLCEVVRGSSPRPQGDSRYYGGKIPRLMVADVTRDGMYVTPQIDSLTDEGAKKSRPMKKGEVVMAVSGNPGLPSILAVDACIHDGFVGYRNLCKRILPEFLYYILLNNMVSNKAKSEGAVFLNLTTDQIKLFPTPVPSIEEQSEIVQKMSIEKSLVDTNKILVEVFEDKIKACLAKVWGE